MTYRLLPKPWGYYAECGARNEPIIEQDLPYLLSGDSYTVEIHSGSFPLRAEVLIELIDEEPGMPRRVRRP